MENVQKCARLELVLSPHHMRKLINKPTFIDCTIYKENLSDFRRGFGDRPEVYVFFFEMY